MSLKTIVLIILFVWGAPSTYFRSKFRKIVYKTVVSILAPRGYLKGNNASS